MSARSDFCAIPSIIYVSGMIKVKPKRVGQAQVVFLSVHVGKRVRTFESVAEYHSNFEY